MSAPATYAASEDPVKVRRAVMKENNAHYKAVAIYLKSLEWLP